MLPGSFWANNERGDFALGAHWIWMTSSRPKRHYGNVTWIQFDLGPRQEVDHNFFKKLEVTSSCHLAWQLLLSLVTFTYQKNRCRFFYAENLRRSGRRDVLRTGADHNSAGRFPLLFEQSGNQEEESAQNGKQWSRHENRNPEAQGLDDKWDQEDFSCRILKVLKNSSSASV